MIYFLLILGLAGIFGLIYKYLAKNVSCKILGHEVDSIHYFGYSEQFKEIQYGLCCLKCKNCTIANSSELKALGPEFKKYISKWEYLDEIDND